MEARNKPEHIHKRVAERCFDQALHLIDSGDLQDAISLLEKATELQPDCDYYQEALLAIKACLSDDSKTSSTPSSQQSASTFASVLKQGLTKQKPSSTPTHTKQCSSVNIGTADMKPTPCSNSLPSCYDSESNSPVDGLSDIPLPYGYEPCDPSSYDFISSADTLKDVSNSRDELANSGLPKENGDSLHSPYCYCSHCLRLSDSEETTQSTSKSSTKDANTEPEGRTPTCTPVRNHRDADFISRSKATPCKPEDLIDSDSDNSNKDDIEQQFLEELYRQRETDDEWESYFQLLKETVENDVKLSKEDEASNAGFTYVQRKSKDYGGLDSFDEIPQLSTKSGKQKTVHSTTSKPVPSAQYKFHNKPKTTGASQEKKKSLYFSNGKCYVGESSPERTVPEKKEAPTVDESEADFYRNLRYYFGGGKVKNRNVPTKETSPNAKMSDKCGTMNKTKEENQVMEDGIPNQEVNNGHTKVNDSNGRKCQPQGTNCRKKEEKSSVGDSAKDEDTKFSFKETQTDIPSQASVSKPDKQKDGSKKYKENPTQEKKASKPGRDMSWAERRKKGKVPRHQPGRNGSKDRKTMDPVDGDVKPGPSQPVAQSTSKGKKKAPEGMGMDEVMQWIWESGKEVFSKCGRALMWIFYYLLVVILLLLFFIAAWAFYLVKGAYRISSDFVMSLSIVAAIRERLWQWKCALLYWTQSARKRITEKLKRKPQTYDLPNTGGDAIQQMLLRKHADPYSILGVPAEASDDDIKRQYRKLAVLIHPDKNPHPDADEAFKILASAFEILGDAGKRREFDMESARRKEEHAGGDKKYANAAEMFADLSRQMQKVRDSLACDACGGRHQRVATNIPLFAARYCASCYVRHPAREGDIWLETSYLGLKNIFYACMEGQVYDVTKWANCQGFHIPGNTHKAPAKLRTETPRHHHPPFRSEEDFVDDLLRDLFTNYHDRHDNCDSSRTSRKPRSRRRKKR